MTAKIYNIVAHNPGAVDFVSDPDSAWFGRHRMSGDQTKDFTQAEWCSWFRDGLAIMNSGLPEETKRMAFAPLDAQYSPLSQGTNDFPESVARQLMRVLDTANIAENQDFGEAYCQICADATQVNTDDNIICLIKIGRIVMPGMLSKALRHMADRFTEKEIKLSPDSLSHFASALRDYVDVQPDNSISKFMTTALPGIKNFRTALNFAIASNHDALSCVKHFVIVWPAARTSSAGVWECVTEQLTERYGDHQMPQVNSFIHDLKAKPASSLNPAG